MVSGSLGRVGDGGLVVRTALVVVNIVERSGAVAGGSVLLARGLAMFLELMGIGSHVSGCLPFSFWLLTRRVRHQALSHRPLGFIASSLLYAVVIPARTRAFSYWLASARAGKKHEIIDFFQDFIKKRNSYIFYLINEVHGFLSAI